MSELSPALISIAGGNEFLFARFYHIYEGVQLVLPESPPIVSGVSDMHPSVSKRGRDTEWDASSDMEEIHEFCFKEFAPSVYSGTFHYLLPIFQTGFL